MATALDLAVPLKVDLAAGPNWLDTRPLDEPARGSVGENRAPGGE
jgi:hypothetical protein